MELSEDEEKMLRNMKKKRQFARATETKLIAKLNDLRHTKDANLLELQIEKLKELVSEISFYDSKIQDFLEEGDYEDDATTSGERKDKSRECLQKSQRILQTLQSPIASPTIRLTDANQAPLQLQLPERKSRLPPLHIKPFNGSVDDWQRFWDQFIATAETNSSASDIEKHTFLRTLLTGSALKLVEGLELSADNYKVVKEKLEKKFGEKDDIIQAHVDAIEGMKPMMNPSTSEIKETFEKIKTRIDALEALKVPLDTLGRTLTKKILHLFPQNICKSWFKHAREQELHKTNLKALATFLEEEVEDLQAAWEVTRTDSGEEESDSNGGNKHSTTEASHLSGSLKKHFKTELTKSKPNNNVAKFRRERDRASMTCYRCQQMGHLSFECSKPSPRTSGSDKKDKAQMTCYRCQQVGHLSYECNKPSVRSVGGDKRVSSCFIRSKVPNLTVVDCWVDVLGRRVDALIDPGANCTVIDKGFLKVGTYIRPNEFGDQFETPNGKRGIDGYIDMEFCIDRVRYKLEGAAVASGLPFPVILGTDWRAKARLVFTFNSRGDVEITRESGEQKKLNFFILRKASAEVCQKSKGGSEEVSLQENGVIEGKAEGSLTNFQQGVENIIGRVDSSVTDKQRERLRQVMLRKREAFSIDGSIGLCIGEECEVPLKTEQPIRVKLRRFNGRDVQRLTETIVKWKELGICQESKSKFNFSFFTVDQPHHPTTPWRPVIDLRPLNKEVDMEVYRMPTIDEIIEVLMESEPEYFNSADIVMAYYNIALKASDTHKIAFNTPLGHMELLRMPVGYKLAPLVMQRIMDSLCNGVVGTRAYVDDIGQGGTPVDIALDRWESLLEALIAKGLKLHIKKCQVLQKEIKFLGYILSAKGRRPDPDRLADIDRFQVFRNVKDVKAFLGFAGYHRQFIKGYAAKASCLTMLTRKDAKFEWSGVHSNAVEIIKVNLKNCSWLGIFRRDCETMLSVDASYEGLGGWLQQRQGGKWITIAFASKGIPDSYASAHSNELECLAVHWCVAEKFRFYLLGIKFVVITDNWAVSHLMQKRELNRKFARWIMDLQEFDFEVRHKAGRNNVVPDALSRAVSLGDRRLVVMAVLLLKDERLRKAQQGDEFCIKMADKLGENFALRGGILCKRTVHKGYENWCVVVPGSMIDELIEHHHIEGGHCDAFKTSSRLVKRYWWPGFIEHIKNWTRNCIPCLRHNYRTVKAEGLLHPRRAPFRPFHTIAMDFGGPYLSSFGFSYMFVAVELYARFLIAEPLRDIKFSTTIRAIEEKIFDRFGVARKFVVDAGTSLISSEMREFAERFGIEIEVTPPYHHASNGLAEGEVKKIIQILRKSSEGGKNWPKLLRKAVWAINTNVHSSLGFSPFELVHGFAPSDTEDSLAVNIPGDIGLEELWRKRQQAEQNLCKAQLAQKRHFDRGRVTSNHKVGDLVLYSKGARVRKFDPLFEGPYKIESTLGSEVYILVDDSGRSWKAHASQLRKFQEKRMAQARRGRRLPAVVAV